MGELNELTKKYYARIIEITTGTEYPTELEKMGAIFAVMAAYIEMMNLTMAEMELG